MARDPFGADPRSPVARRSVRSSRFQNHRCFPMIGPPSMSPSMVLAQSSGRPGMFSLPAGRKLLVARAQSMGSEFSCVLVANQSGRPSYARPLLHYYYIYYRFSTISFMPSSNSTVGLYPSSVEILVMSASCDFT